MKVTKLIREYVQERVSKVYDPAIEAADKAAAEAKTAAKQRFAVFEDDLHDFAKLLADEANAKLLVFAEERGVAIVSSSYTNAQKFFAVSIDADSTPTKKEADRANTLRNQRNAKVREILVGLELGATKTELERLLASVTVD